MASYDEDSTTLGVAAARQALAAAPPGVRPGSLWFATVSPAYLDKTNATAIHAALRLPDDAAAFDAGGAVRSAVGALRAGLAGPGPALVVAADIRTGRPGLARRGRGRRCRRPRCWWARTPTVRWWPRFWASAAATEEFLDRWRVPGESHSRRWEERFGEGRYATLGARAWDDALKAAGVVAEQVDRVVIAASHGRAATMLARTLGVDARLAPGLDATVGFTGAAHPAPGPGRRPRRRRAGRGHRPGGAGRRGRRGRAAHHRGAGRRPPGRHRRGPGGGGRPAALRQGPGLAGLPAGGAAPPPGARPPVRRRGGPLGVVEVRARGPGRPPPGRRPGHDRDLHGRPAGLLALAAGGVRGGRLRRRRPAAGRAHRRGRGGRRHRRPGGDDLPPPVHRRRHPQLLLEGPAGPGGEAANGIARDPRPGGDRRHGVHPLRRALGQGRRRAAARRHRRGLRRHRHRQGRRSTPTGWARPSRA